MDSHVSVTGCLLLWSAVVTRLDPWPDKVQRADATNANKVGLQLGSGGDDLVMTIHTGDVKRKVQTF
jgi:hypothetical protein